MFAGLCEHFSWPLERPPTAWRYICDSSPWHWCLRSPNSYRENNSAEEKDRPSCLEETRVELLDEVYRWAESDQLGEPHIFWPQGSAGTDKSTVSRTVARFLDNMGLLGASFFFSRDKDLRKHSNRLFTTIASDLVKSFPVIKEQVLDEIRKDDQISTMPLEIHFENLILGPCRDCVKDEVTIVLVIDALGESA
jgi:hypothetical protein